MSRRRSKGTPKNLKKLDFRELQSLRQSSMGNPYLTRKSLIVNDIRTQLKTASLVPRALLAEAGDCSHQAKLRS
jgi:hypothetical protein